MGKLIAVSLLAATLAAPPDVSIRASPQWGFDLSTRVTILVEPHPANSNLCWSYDSGEVYSSSCWRLDGDRAPRQTIKTIQHLPQGVYILEVEVLRSDGTRKVATTKMCSLGEAVGMDQCNPSIQ